jgi:hypothetical protein
MLRTPVKTLLRAAAMAKGPGDSRPRDGYFGSDLESVRGSALVLDDQVVHATII